MRLSRSDSNRAHLQATSVALVDCRDDCSWEHVASSFRRNEMLHLQQFMMIVPREREAAWCFRCHLANCSGRKRLVVLKMGWLSDSALTMRSQHWNSPGGRNNPHHAPPRATTSTTSHFHAISRHFRREQLRNGDASLKAISAITRLSQSRKKSAIAVKSVSDMMTTFSEWILGTFGDGL